MGHDEDKNNFNGGTTPVNPVPVTPNPRAQFGNNRIGMRPSRDFSANSAQEELNRISGVTPQTQANNGGDIILAAAKPEKKNNKIIIAFIIGLAVMVILAVVLLVVKNNTTTSVASNDFVKYLLNGDGNIKTNDKNEKVALLSDYIDNNKSIYPFTFYTLSSKSSFRDKNIDSYFSNVHAKFEEFKKSYSGGKSAAIEKLGVLIELTEKNVNYMKTKEENISQYSSNPQKYKSVFTENFADTQYSELDEVSLYQRQYYDSEMSYIAYFDSIGCLINSKPSIDCVVLKGDVHVAGDIDEKENTIDRSFRAMASKSGILNREIVNTLAEINGR